MKREEIWVRSSLDGTMQPSLFFEAEGENRPCIVGLHTWSFGRENQILYLLSMAEELNFKERTKVLKIYYVVLILMKLFLIRLFLKKNLNFMV